MFITVKLLNGYARQFTYKVPESWDKEKLRGTIVKVPLQRRFELACVIDIFEFLPAGTTFTVKEAYAQEHLPHDESYVVFVEQLSAYYLLEPVLLYKRMRKFLQDEHEQLDVQGGEQLTIASQVQLTVEQQLVVDDICPHITHHIFRPTLLHGVTGSGKTEVYKKIIEHAFSQGKNSLLLLPEVSLAVQFMWLLRKQLPHILILGFHSATSVSEKRIVWQHLLSGKPALIIGVHLPLLLPIPNLGIIIVDEEHDAGFQEKKWPRIHTKEAALLRAQIARIPILLGSATPSLSSLQSVKTRSWIFFQLKQRFAGKFPQIKLVKMVREKRDNFWISKELQEALGICLARGEQAIIFLNRRGYSFFVQCMDCNFVFTCESCSVSLTLHYYTELLCHYCGYKEQLASACPKCAAKSTSFLKKGIGTQQIVGILEKMFPQAGIGRLDMDTTVNKKKFQETISAFQNQKLQILVGTQTITKGYHFPRVTLVGILWADCNLNFPFYSSAETTLQQLIQVAGRAGRELETSMVVVQTFKEHPIFKYINEIDYINYFDYEIAYRTELQYPPIIRLAEIELRSPDELVLDAEALAVCDTLYALVEKQSMHVVILGPAQPMVHKIKNVFIQKIYLKSASIKLIHALFVGIEQSKFTSTILFTPNPLS